jgi:hypothetical protein
VFRSVVEVALVVLSVPVLPAEDVVAFAGEAEQTDLAFALEAGTFVCLHIS